MTIPNFGMPHLGATGLIQNPGDVGAVGQALGGIAPLIMQQQQQMQNQQYQQALMAQMQHAQQRQDLSRTQYGVLTKGFEALKAGDRSSAQMHFQAAEAYNRPCPDCAPAFAAIAVARGLEV